MQESEERQDFKWPLSAEDAAALGGVVKGLSQSPQADCIEWPFKLPSNVFPAEEAKTDSCEASQCDALLLKECFAVDVARKLRRVAKFHRVSTQ